MINTKQTLKFCEKQQTKVGRTLLPLLISLTSSLVVADRRLHPTEKRDILYSMMNEKDPKTGLKLSDESITNNVGPFIIVFRSI